MKKKTCITMAAVTLLCTVATSTAFTHAQADLMNTSQSSSVDVKSNADGRVNNPSFLGGDILTNILNPEDYYFISPNPVHSGDTNITGSCSEVGNYTVTAYDSSQHGVLIGDPVATNLGEFNISTYQPLKKGMQILLVLRQGDTYLAQSEIVVDEGTEEIPAPIVDQPVYNGDTAVTGTGYKSGDTIIITNEEGSKIGSGTVDSNLKYSVTIPPQPAYSTLYVVETDGVNTSNPTKVIVHEGSTASDKITSVDDYSLTAGDGLVHGTYTGEKAVNINVTVNGVPSPIIPIQPGSGQFIYRIQDLVTSTNQVVFVNLFDENKTMLDSHIVNIIE